MSDETDNLQFSRRKTMRTMQAMQGPLLLDRSLLRVTEPFVEAIYANFARFCRHDEETLSGCFGFNVYTSVVRDLLKVIWEYQGIDDSRVSSTSLFMYLPDEFEPVLKELVATTPEPFNQQNIDLCDELTYYGWSCKLPGESKITKICVADGYLTDTIACAYRVAKRKPGWIPVVMTAGNSIAIYGFSVDEKLIASASEKTMYCRDFIPEMYYSDEQMHAADKLAEEIGLVPWYHRRYIKPDGEALIGVRMYPCQYT